MKSEADRPFALYEREIQQARTEKVDLVELEDVCKWLRKANERARSKDKTAPLLIVIHDESTKVRATERWRMEAKGFHVTRSYCASASPTTRAGNRFGVRIFNHVFSLYEWVHRAYIFNRTSPFT